MKKKIPEDLGLKIGTKEQVIWESVKKNCVALIEQYEKELFVQKEILKLSEMKIELEKQKLKN